MATPSSMPAAQALRVRDEEVVADELDPVAESLGERLPARPSRPRRGRPRSRRSGSGRRARVERRSARRRRASAPPSSVVGAVAEELGRGRVERDRDAVAWPARSAASSTASIAASADGEVRREAALVADGRREPALVQQRLQRVVDLGADPQGLGERSAPAGTSMNSWKSSEFCACAPPLIDVHHRHGQDVRRSSPPR